MILILFLAVSLFGVKYAGRGKFFDDSFSVSDTRALKGFFAIAVVLHHLVPNLASPFTSLLFFENVGYLAVGGFFLISGYGLMYGAKHKKDYLKGFFRKRLSAVLIPHYLVLPFYAFARYLMGALSLDYIKQFLTGIVMWYAAAITVMYICFFVSVKLFGVKWGKVMLTALAAIYAAALLYLYRNGNMNFGFWWYNSIICFPIGMWYCDLREALHRLAHRFYYPLGIVCAALFCLFFVIADRGSGSTRLYVLASQVICASLFCVLVILLSMKLRLTNKLLLLCGDLSFELYLTHALFIYFFRSGLSAFGYTLYLSSSDFFMAAVLIATLVMSYVMHKISRLLHRGLCSIGAPKKSVK